MPVKDILDSIEDHMKKAVEHTRQQLARVRTGRASTSLLENVRVDYYGEATPITQVGSVSTPDARTVLIQPWDKSILNAIERAILAANLGMTPQSDGQVIRLNVPPLTEERRKEIVKMCKKTAEDGRLAIRNVRRDANEDLKKAEKSEHFSEDERKRGEEAVQKLTDRYIKEIDDLTAEKEREIMSDD